MPNPGGGVCLGWCQRCHSWPGHLPLLLTGGYPEVCLLPISGPGNTSEHLLWARWFHLPYFWPPHVCFLGSPSLPSCAVPLVKLFLTLLSLPLGFLAMPLGSAVEMLATDDPNFSQDDQQDTQIYEKHDNLLHGHRKKKWAFLRPVPWGNRRFVSC